MHKRSKKEIPYFHDINTFLEATQVKNRTGNPLFYCMRLKEHKKQIYMSPFKRGFYFIGLLTTRKNTRVAYNGKDVSILDSFIVFQSPNLLYSFYRELGTEGYLIYFKEECLDFFKPDIKKEFPFFNILNTTLFQIDTNQYNEISTQFEHLFQTAEQNEGLHNNKITTVKLLALLYELLDFPIISQSLKLEQHVDNELVRQFIQLVNVHYIDKKTISKYATLLSISEDHLAKSIKSETGKTAYSFIIARIIKEAKDLISFTPLTFSEIAYQLNFSDTSNFSKCFKRETGLSPTAYRNTFKSR